MAKEKIKTYRSEFLLNRGKYIMFREGYTEKSREVLSDGAIKVTWHKAPKIPFVDRGELMLQLSSRPRVRGSITSILQFEGSKYKQ